MPESVELAYGNSTVEFAPEPDRFIGLLSPQSAEPLSSLQEALQRSLAHPIDSPPLRDKLQDVRSMLILTVDITRPTPTPLMRPVLQLCHEFDIAVTICISLGRHGAMTEASLREFLTPDVYDRYTVVQHDAFDDEIHLEHGFTSRQTPIKVNRIFQEHDFICGLSFIEPSYLMGYSGSRKLIIPGIAHHSSIDANHYWLTHPDTRIGELDRNPMHQDAMEFMEHFRFDWLTCAVLNGTDRVTEVVSGDWITAHRRACEASDRIFRIPGKQAAIVVSSPGGYPYDLDLVQGKKAIIPAIECVRPGGAIILLAECPDGWGAEGAFREWLLGKSPEAVVQDVKDREQFNLGAHGAYILARPIVEKNAAVILVTNEQLVEGLQGSYVHAVTTFEEALSRAERLCHATRPDYLAIRNARRLIVEHGSPPMR